MKLIKDNFHLTLFCLVIVGLILNLDRLLLGESGTLRRVDVSDILIAKFQYLGQYWRHPFDFAWNASIMRGWPIYLETVQPQHLCNILSSFLPAHVSFTIFQIIVDVFILIGTYMFFYNFIGFRHVTALYGSLFSLAMFYWFNENPYVIQVQLLPLIVAISSVGKLRISFKIRLTCLVLIFLMSYPPYTFPMLPLMHIIVTFLLSSSDKRWRNVALAVVLWGIFVIFYFSNLIAIAFHLTQSNRILWELRPPEFSFSSLMGYLRNINVWFPSICAIAMFNFWKYPKARILLALVFGIALFSSQTSLYSGVPVLKSLSFAWGRLYYFISFILLLLLCYLIEKNPLSNFTKGIGAQIFRLLICILLSTIMLGTYTSFTIKFFIALGVLSFLLIKFNVLKFATNGIKLVIIAVIFLAPAKYAYTYYFEPMHYGNLTLDPFVYRSSFTPYRVISVSENCFPQRFFSAQALYKGQETFDGVSVFYNGVDAKNWLKYVVPLQDPCAFRHWNNRMELTAQMGSSKALKWLRFNNVVFVRSEFPIDHPQLILEKKEMIRSYYLPKVSSLEKKFILSEWYLYRIENPISRIMSIPSQELVDKEGKVLEDQIFFDALDELPLSNVTVESYTPSRLSWEGSFDNKEFLASINFHPGWQLWVDNVLIKGAVRQGPFGMLQISSLPGQHNYVLRYQDSMFFYMLAFGMVGLYLLFLFTKVLIQRFER